MRVVRYQFLGADLLEKVINLGHHCLSSVNSWLLLPSVI